MSDNGIPIQPAAEPVAPVPIAAPDASTAPVATPEQPPKKKRGCLIAAVVAAVLVLCGIAGAVAFVMSTSGDSEQIALAETHYTQASAAVDKASETIGAATDEDGSTREMVDSASKSLRVARDELAAARVAIEQIDESQGRTDYLASLDAATQALDSLEDILDYLNTAENMLGVIEKASEAASEAGDDLNDAISAGNARDYAKMKSRAQDAAEGFAVAAELFAEAHELDESAGLDKAGDYVAIRKKQAAGVIDMAGYGKAGKTKEYNDAIDKMEKLSDDADKIGEPAIVSDPDWTEKRLAELLATSEEAGARADELRLKALEALGYTP